MFSDPTYQMRARPSENPTHGSGWIVSNPAYASRYFDVIIGRLKVGSEQSTHFRGWDSQISKAAVCRLDLNNPPTSEGGIPELSDGLWSCGIDRILSFSAAYRR